MKKLTLLLVSFFAVFALGLTGCSDDPDVKQETPVIKASNPADIAAVAGKVTVPYTVDYAVDGCSLDVTWDATWLHDLSVSADKFTLQADANPGAAREAKLTLTYPEATSVELTVRQMSASESISISPKTLSFSYKGGEETVTVTSSKSWTLEGSADWVEADKTEGESGESVVKFTVSTTNETDAAKEVTFNFVSGSEKAPLKIQQNQEGEAHHRRGFENDICVQYGAECNGETSDEHRACDGYDRGGSRLDRGCGYPRYDRQGVLVQGVGEYGGWPA